MKLYNKCQVILTINNFDSKSLILREIYKRIKIIIIICLSRSAGGRQGLNPRDRRFSLPQRAKCDTPSSLTSVPQINCTDRLSQKLRLIQPEFERSNSRSKLFMIIV